MIWLQYGNYSAGLITWQPIQEFTETRIIPNKLVKRETNYDLRSEPYSHIKSKRNNWDLVISADELTTTSKLTFLQELYEADTWRLGGTYTSGHTYGYGDGYGYGYFTEVFLLADKEEFPMELLEDSLSFPEVGLKFIEKENGL